MPLLEEVIIIGSGWAGSTLATSLDETKYSITVISPETTTPYTPLLASAACRLYDFNIVETPIRHASKKIKFVKGRVENIDFKAKTVKGIPAFEDLAVKEFDLHYDIVVIAPEVSSQISPATSFSADLLPSEHEQHFQHSGRCRIRSLPPERQRCHENRFSDSRLL